MKIITFVDVRCCRCCPYCWIIFSRRSKLRCVRTNFHQNQKGHCTRLDGAANAADFIVNHKKRWARSWTTVATIETMWSSESIWETTERTNSIRNWLERRRDVECMARHRIQAELHSPRWRRRRTAGPSHQSLSAAANSNDLMQFEKTFAQFCCHGIRECVHRSNVIAEQHSNNVGFSECTLHTLHTLHTRWSVNKWMRIK